MKVKVGGPCIPSHVSPMPPVQDNPDLLEIVKPLHIYLSWFAGLLIAGHALAAIKHHIIDKDNVLLSMLRQPK